MKKNITLKNMKEALVNGSGDKADFEKIWDAFLTMKQLGFISDDLWKKFFNECKGWYFDVDNYAIMKFGAEGYEMIWEYNQHSRYTA